MTTTARDGATSRRQLINKVPEVTIWFWVIKILCTTVGESFADWINMRLGVGLLHTSYLFTAVLVVVLAVQLRLRAYVPAAYWLTVVVVSVTGTLYTDILTDDHHVPLRLSSSVFAVVLAVVFGAWWLRERTLSIHSIVTFPREAFYWLAVLVTFSLGTAVGDWTLELTGWGPGPSVLVPAGLIAVITICWRFGAQPVLSFWLAYVLTRPLGANIGDWLASPRADKGLGLGTAATSVVFLVAILATVVYLTLSKSDVIPANEVEARTVEPPARDRERLMLVPLGLVAVLTALLLRHASQQPHVSALDEEEGSSAPVTQLSAAQAVAHLPAADVATLDREAAAIQAAVSAGDTAAARVKATALETTWDDDEARLKPLDPTAWTYVDSQIDDVLSAVRAKAPVAADESRALAALRTTLQG